MFPVRDFSDSFKVVVRVGRGLGGRVRVCRGDRVRVDRLGAIGSARSAAGAIGSGWIDRVGSAGSGRSGGGGDPVQVDRLGSTGSPRSAGGRSGPSGSIDQVLLDRPAQRRGRSGPGGSIESVQLDRGGLAAGAIRFGSVDRSGSTGSARSGGGGDPVQVDRLGSTGSPRSAGGRSGPSGSIDQVLLDRHAQRRGDPVRVDRSIGFT